MTIIEPKNSLKNSRQIDDVDAAAAGAEESGGCGHLEDVGVAGNAQKPGPLASIGTSSSSWNDTGRSRRSSQERALALLDGCSQKSGVAEPNFVEAQAFAWLHCGSSLRCATLHYATQA